jgi:hypothetical protein
MEDSTSETVKPSPQLVKPPPKRYARPPKPPAPGARTAWKKEKPPDFTITPYPTDITKGSLDKLGIWRWSSPVDAMDWAHEVWSDPRNRMRAYLYRNRPVCNYEQSAPSDVEEMEHSVTTWDKWPFDSPDYHIGMLNEFGGGSYMILFKDTVVNRNIAKIENYEFPWTTQYPPHIRVDDVVIDSPHNKQFIGWARNNGVLFPNDKGYQPGQFVHQVVQARGTDNMSNDPINQAVREVTGDLIRDAVQNIKSPTAPAPPVESRAVDAEAARASIELVKSSANYAIQQNERESNSTKELLSTLLPLITKQPDKTEDKTMALLLQTMQATAAAQIATLQEDKKELARRLERMEERAWSVPVPPPQKTPLEALVEMKHLMSELGYAPQGGRGSRPPEEASSPSLVDALLEKLPDLLNAGVNAWTSYTNAQIQIAQIAAYNAQLAAGGTPQAPPQQAPPPPPQRPATPQPATGPSNPGAPAPPVYPHRPTANEAVRGALGAEFDMIVEAFHPELDKFYRVVSAKFLAGVHTIAQEKVVDIAEQVEIMADSGCELALWYTQLPDDRGMIGDRHAAWRDMVANKPYIVKGLMTYRPIWEVMGQAPPELINGFIEGFCDFHRLDDDGDDSEGDEVPAPVIEMAKVN